VSGTGLLFEKYFRKLLVKKKCLFPYIEQMCVLIAHNRLAAFRRILLHRMNYLTLTNRGELKSIINVSRYNGYKKYLRSIKNSRTQI
jgi:hypothetical protein